MRAKHILNQVNDFKRESAECALGSGITCHHDREAQPWRVVIQKFPRLLRAALLAMTIQSNPQNLFALLEWEIA